MSWLSSIPLIGNLVDSIGNAIDKNVTTDEERLKLKAELTSLLIPIITALVEAQKSHNELQARTIEAEAKSEHWLVWARRPILGILAGLNFFVSLWLFSMGQLVDWQMVEFSFYFAGLVNGLDFSTRGIEKIVRTLKSKEEI